MPRLFLFFRSINVPYGKTLCSVDPEAAAFYESLGNTKVTGEMHNAVGDIYMDYMDIPESVVSNNDFDAFRKSYYTYAENPDIENAYTFLGEASKIYDMPGVKQHTFDPKATMDTAMDADYNARMRGMLDEAQTAGKSGMSAGEFAQSKGVPGTLTDAETAGAAGVTMKMDEDGSGGYNGGDGRTNNAGNFREVNGLEDFRSRIPANAEELPWRNIEGGAKEGVRYRWTDTEGNIWDVRAHSVDPKAPTGSNANKGWIYRVEVRWGGRGKKYYMDLSGNFHPYNVTNPNSPMYDEAIANDTHIILDREK